MAYNSQYKGSQIDLAVGAVLEKEETGTEGQILTKTASGSEWMNAPDTGVTTFNGRTGAVTPQTGDYTADMVGARANTWVPTAAEVGALPDTTSIPTALSDLSDDATHRTVTDTEKNTWNAKAGKPTTVTVTLTASGWSDNTQTVTVSGVSATETAQLIQPMPAIASQTVYVEAGILCTGQASNSLTFTATTVPSENLTVYVVITEL